MTDTVVPDEARLDDLLPLVNEHLTRVPPRLMIKRDSLRSLLQGPSPWDCHYPEDPPGIPGPLLTVPAKGRVVAAAQWIEVAAREGHPRRQWSWMLCDAGREDDLARLLRDHAPCGWPARFGLGLGWFGIPDSWPHVLEACRRAGGRATETWVLFERPADARALDPASPLDGLAWEWHLDAARGEWELRATGPGGMAGECLAWGVPAALASSPGYGEWITIEFVGVEPPWRRRGLGRRLLAGQMAFQARRGMAHVMLWTEPDNAAMLALARTLGFQPGPACQVFG